MRIADQKKSNQKHLDVGSLKPKQKHLMAQTWPRLEGWKPVSSRPSSSWQTSSTSCPTEERPRDTWFKNSIYGTKQISSLIKKLSPVGKSERPEILIQYLPLPAHPGKSEEPDRKKFQRSNKFGVDKYQEKVILDGKEANTSGVRSSACTVRKK